VTNEGITATSKVLGSVFFTASSVPVPVADGDLPGATKVDSSGVVVPPNNEEARLLKHVKKNSMGFKSSNPVAQSTGKVEVSSSTTEVSAGAKPASRDDAEEARLMKHVYAKASKAVQSGTVPLFLTSQGASVKGSPVVPTKVGTPPGTPTENASPTIPTWKLKQIERENQERAKREQERAKLAAISQTIASEPSVANSSGSDGANSNVNTETAGASVNVNGTGASDEGAVKSSIFGSTVDPESDERLKKEEERLMKLMAGKSKGIKF